MISVGDLIATLRLRDDLTPMLKQIDAQLAQTGEKFADLGSKVSRLGSSLIPLSAAFAGAAGASLLFSSNFETTMTRLVSLAGVSKEELAGVKQHILDLAPAVGIGPQALADGMMVVSSTVADTKVAMSILDIAAKGSAAGMGETKDVAKALTAVINSYGAANITAAQAGDILTKTVQDGGAEAKELAPVLANVVPMAAQMGISFAEVGANIATFTKLGVPAAESVTSLSAVMTALLKPTNEGEAALRSIGLSFEQLRQKVAGQGLAASMTELATKFGDNKEAMAQVFGRVEALRNVMGTAGQQAVTYADEIKRISDSAGTLQGAFDAMKGTQAQTWSEISAKLQVVAIAFGDALAPAMKKALEATKPLLDGILKLANWFAQLPAPVQSVLIAFGALVAAAAPLLMIFGSVMTGIGALIPLLPTAASAFGVLSGAIAFITGPIGLTIIAIAALVAALKYFGVLGSVVSFFTDLGTIIKGEVGAAFEYVAPIVTSVAHVLGGALLTSVQNLFGPLVDGVAFVKNLGVAFGEWLLPKVQKVREIIEYLAGTFQDLHPLVVQAEKGIQDYGKGLQDTQHRVLSVDDALNTYSTGLGAAVTEQQKHAAEVKTSTSAMMSLYEQFKQAQASVASFTHEQQQAIVAGHAMGQTEQQIAQSLHLSEAAVKIYLDRLQEGKAAKEAFKKATEEVQSAGEGWRGTLDTISGSTVEAIKYYIQAGVEQKELATYYGLTATQIKAVDSSLKDEIETQKMADKIHEMTAKRELDWQEEILKERAKNAETINKAVADGYLQNKAAQEAYVDFVMQTSSTSTDYQVFQIDRWVEQQLTAYSGDVAHFAEYKAKIEALAEAKTEALYVDDKALVEHSQTNLRQIADRAWATYESMTENADEYSAKTIVDFKKIAEAAENAAEGISHPFSDAFKNIAGNIPGLVQQAFTGGGGVAGAGKAIGSMVGQNLGDGLVGHLAEKAPEFMSGALGNMLGAAIPMVGSLVGPLVGKLVSALANIGGPSKAEVDARTKQADEVKQLMASATEEQLAQIKKVEEATSASTHRNEQTYATLAVMAGDAFKKVGMSAAEADTHMKDLLNTHDPAAFARGMEALNTALEKTKQHAADVAVANDAMVKSFNLSVAATKTFADEAKSLHTDVMNAMKALTDEIKKDGDSALDVNRKLTTAFMAASNAQSKAATEHVGELKDLGLQAVATYNMLIASGKTAAEALSAVGPGLDQLGNLFQDLGIDIEDAGLKALVMQERMLKRNPELIAGVDALASAVGATSKAGTLSVAQFEAMQRTGISMYQRLQESANASGGATEDALKPMQDYLHNAQDAATKLGVPMNDNLQLLIQQSKELGLWQETGTAAAIDNTGKMNELAIATQGVAAAIDSIPKSFVVTGQLVWQAAAMPGGGNSNNTGNGLSDADHAYLGGLVHEAGVQYLAYGGLANGPRGTDTVNAWLTPGEGVVSPLGMSKLGESGLRDLNHGLAPTSGNDDAIKALAKEMSALRMDMARRDNSLPLHIGRAVRDQVQNVSTRRGR